MLNGKFYTGLTENQLNRSSGPNRQKTNFFWPDESETTPKQSTPRSRNNDSARKYNEDSGGVRNSPKELFKTQLSSKIEFYDTANALKTPPSVRKQNQMRELNRTLYEKNLNSHANGSPIKPKTFESKIEFYDFVETEKPKEPTTAKFNSTKMVHDKKQNSFDGTDEWDKTKKGILKNRDVGLRVERNVPIDISEHRTFTRNNGSQLQLSKSMDNVTKLKLSYNDDQNDRNEKVNEMTNQLNKLNINNKEKINLSRRIEPRYEDDGEYSSKAYNDSTNGYNDHSKYSTPTQRNERNVQRNSFHGLNNGNLEFSEDRYSTTKSYDDKVNGRRHSDQYDHKERTNVRNHLHTKNNTFNDRLQASAFDETDEFHEETTKRISDSGRYRNEPRNERVVQLNVEKTRNVPDNGRYRNEPRNERVVEFNIEKTKNIPENGIRYRSEPRNERVVEFQEEETKKIAESGRYYSEPRNERAVNLRRSSTMHGANDYPNEARRRAHTHLQSNIFFQDDIRMQQQRPLSIRESAVTRVGVGLPDII